MKHETTKFGKEVMKLMIDKDLSISDVAARLGVSTAYISAIFRGLKKPSGSFIQMLEVHGLLNEEARVAYALTIGSVDISGMPWVQVAEVVALVRKLKMGH